MTQHSQAPHHLHHSTMLRVHMLKLAAFIVMAVQQCCYHLVGPIVQSLRHLAWRFDTQQNGCSLATGLDGDILGLGAEQKTLHSAQVTAIWTGKPKVDIIYSTLPFSVPLGSSNSQHAFGLTVVLFLLSSAVISPLQYIDIMVSTPSNLLNLRSKTILLSLCALY